MESDGEVRGIGGFEVDAVGVLGRNPRESGADQSVVQCELAISAEVGKLRWSH